MASVEITRFNFAWRGRDNWLVFIGFMLTQNNSNFLGYLNLLPSVSSVSLKLIQCFEKHTFSVLKFCSELLKCPKTPVKYNQWNLLV